MMSLEALMIRFSLSVIGSCFKSLAPAMESANSADKTQKLKILILLPLLDHYTTRFPYSLLCCS